MISAPVQLPAKCIPNTLSVKSSEMVYGDSRVFQDTTFSPYSCPAVFGGRIEKNGRINKTV